MRLLVIRRAEELSVRGRSTIVIRVEGRTIERGLRDVDAVLIIGSHVRLSSALPPVLSAHNIPLAIMAKDSVSILVNPILTRYNSYRRLQYQLDRNRALEIAAGYIESKIRGMQNILKYHKVEAVEVPPPPGMPDNSNPDDYELEIRLWESTASHALWGKLLDLLEPDVLDRLRSEYGFRGRAPRHPDPFNKTLSVMYAVLYSLATKALIAAGLDPTYGFLHRTRYSTPLTFDYTEMFKPIAIQAAVELVNKNGLPELDPDGELARDAVNSAVRQLYSYLTLRHKYTGRTPYQQIHLKAFCLARHLEGKCAKGKLTITWDRRQYRAKH